MLDYKRETHALSLLNLFITSFYTVIRYWLLCCTGDQLRL